MALSYAYLKNKTKWSGKPNGDKHSDGKGLYLHVKEAGKYWRMAYRFQGKQRTLAIGVYPNVSLADARRATEAAKVQLANGIDPSLAKREARHADRVAAATTYEAVAREFHQLKLDSWSEAHAGKWLRMNEMYLFPEIGRMAISTITAKRVLDALRKVEAKGILSTAQDLQQMAGQVFRYALQTDRIAQNPIPDLKGALKPHVPQHFAAITDPQEVGKLLRAIDGYSGSPVTRLALQLAALFFQRPGNIRSLEWTWVDLDNAMVTIPPAQMKRRKHEKVNGRPHLIPLATQALAILKEVQTIAGGGIYVFPGARSRQRPMSNNTMNAALKRLDYGTDDHVSHGFRAMARTMLAERIKGINNDMVEAQLGHGKSGPLGSAYDRAEYLEQRRHMMQVWADYLEQLRNGAELVQFKRA